MPLTRHFYEADDVHAALAYASCRAQHQETLFWCKELLCSGYASEAISTLFETWVWQRGPFHLRWLVEAWRLLQGAEVTEEAILLSAYQLSACTRRDGSLWRILAATVSFTNVPPDHVTKRTPKVLPRDTAPIELYFIRALYQGKALAAWWASRYLTDDRVWWLLGWMVDTVQGSVEDRLCLEALRGYEELLGYRTAEYDVVMRCLAVLSIASSANIARRNTTSPALPTAIDARYHGTMAAWDAIEGRRARRIYQVPRCSTKNSLYDVERGIRGCPFWETALEDYARPSGPNEPIPWVSDDAMEAFYDTFFPDDIPDEWTKAEKEKSQGHVRPPLSRAALVRLYQPTISRLCWTTWPSVPDSADGGLASIVNDFPAVQGIPDDVAPRKKQVRVIS